MKLAVKLVKELSRERVKAPRTRRVEHKKIDDDFCPVCGEGLNRGFCASCDVEID